MRTDDSQTLETDYLVVGAGAAGMAFTDALVESCDARVVVVDRRHAPGGHWLDAYPFVRLHMPSSFYGVNSLPLGTDTRDSHGPNAGLYELASAAEICAYYDRVMRERLLPSGRVRYLPMCEYRGGHDVVSRVSGARYQVTVRRRVVDATYLESSVPATTPAPFEVEPGVRCEPVGELTRVAEPPDGYVLVGAGKTAIDACLWLLDADVPPELIRWIKPREPWLLNRAFFQAGELIGASLEAFADASAAGAEAQSVPDYFDRLVAAGWLSQVDGSVAPTMLKAATTTPSELEQLRRIEQVVRLGHVRRIGPDVIALENGTVPTSPGTLHVHCAAAGLNLAPAVPIFSADRVVLQPIRFGLICFSAALAGFVEATRDDPADKNRLCPPNPKPDVPLDLPRGLLVQGKAEALWLFEPDVAAWVDQTRLNLFRELPERLGDPDVQRAYLRFADRQQAALENLGRLLMGVPA